MSICDKTKKTLTITTFTIDSFVCSCRAFDRSRWKSRNRLRNNILRFPLSLSSRFSFLFFFFVVVIISLCYFFDNSFDNRVTRNSYKSIDRLQYNDVLDTLDRHCKKNERQTERERKRRNNSILFPIWELMFSLSSRIRKKILRFARVFFFCSYWRLWKTHRKKWNVI